MTRGWVQGNQGRMFRQPDNFGDEDVYCEANHEPDDVLYIGSDDDEYRSSTERRQRIEAQARRYLQGKRLHLISAALSGPFTKDSGWTNPWRSKSGVRKSSKRKHSPTAKKPVTKVQSPAPCESSELSSPRSDIVQIDDAPTQDVNDESLARVQNWRDRVLAEISVNATPTHQYSPQTEPQIEPSKPPAPEIPEDDTSSELSPPPDSHLSATPIRQKNTIAYRAPSQRKEEPGAGQPMLLPLIDLSPHAIKLFEESFYSRESSKSSPARQQFAGSPLKNCTPAPRTSIQQPLEEPTIAETPANVGSAVTPTSENIPGSTQTDGSFQFRKTRQKQRNLPLRKSSGLSGMVFGEDRKTEKRNQRDEVLPEIQVAEDQTVDPMQIDQHAPQTTALSSSHKEAAFNPPEPEHQNVAQEQIEHQSHDEESEQGAIESSQTTSSQIDGVTLVPPSSSEEECEDVNMGNFPCEKEPASQDAAAVLGFPKRLLWPKPDPSATGQNSSLTFRVYSAPAPVLSKARKPDVPEPDQAAVAVQPISKVAESANADVTAVETSNADLAKSDPVEIEETEVTEEGTAPNMALKPEQKFKEPQIPEPEVLEPRVPEPVVPATTPTPQPKPAPEPELVAAPAPEPIPEPRTATSPVSLAPAVNSLMAETAHRASQGLTALRRVLEQGTESSQSTENAVVLGASGASDAEAATAEEQSSDAALSSSLADETASLPLPGAEASQITLHHPHVDVAFEKAVDEVHSSSGIEKEAQTESETASEAEGMDVDTEDSADIEKAKEVTDDTLETESTPVSSHRSPSLAPVEQSPWAVDTVSLPSGVNNNTPVPSRVVDLAAPDSCQQPATQSPWAKGDSQLQVTIPPATEIRSFVPFSSPANSAVLQRPETPPSQIIFPGGNNNSQASIAQLSTPESNRSVHRTPESNNFGLSTKSFRDFMTPSPKPAKRRKISKMSSVRNSAGPISSTQLLFDAATANPWTPGIMSSGGRSLRPTPSTIKPKSLLRQSLSSSTPLDFRKRKYVTFAPLPGEITPLPASSPVPSPNPHPSSPYFSAEYPSTLPTTTITVSTPVTPVPSSLPKIRPSSPPPSSISADLPTASTEKFSKHFAKVATKRLGHTTFANPIVKLRQQKRLLPSSSQQVCESPNVEAMAEAFLSANAPTRQSPTPAPVLPEEQDDEALMQSQLDSQLGIVIEDGKDHAYNGETTESETQQESQDHVSDVLLNLDDFLGVGGGLWDVDTAVKDMARDQRREEEERKRQQSETTRLEKGFGGRVWE